MCALPETFGDPDIDFSFRQSAKAELEWFRAAAPVSGVHIYQECSSSNAFANPQDRGIYFGINLARYLQPSGRGATGMLIILAHEFGHQVQFNSGWYSGLQVPTSVKELEADFFAGFFVGARSAGNAADFSDLFAVLHDLGDEEFTNPSHHGTPTERSTMSYWGFDIGTQVARSGQQVTWDWVHQSAQEKIRAMSPTLARELTLRADSKGL